VITYIGDLNSLSLVSKYLLLCDIVCRQRLVSCAACGLRDFTKCLDEVSIRDLPEIFLMTTEQRTLMSELPVVSLFKEDGSIRQQALAPAFSCFPAWRNISDNESSECYQMSLRDDLTPRYHLHADLVAVPQVKICSMFVQSLYLYLISIFY
jgi:hypothetical protein